MNYIEQFEHDGNWHDKENFMQLLQVALADGIIDKFELELLHRIGIKMGFTDPEIDILIESFSKLAYNPPYELSKRFLQVYDLVKIILANGKIDKNEMRLVYGFATKSGFNDREIPCLLVLLIKGIKEDKDEDDLFKVFIKERKF
jgi:hypothetical protein